MDSPYELPDALSLLAADVADMEYQIDALNADNKRLRLMLSEAMEIAHQAVSRAFALSQAK